MVDYSVKFPEAVPLRKVDTSTVAEAMLSKYIYMILTTKGISRVKTLLYHPQTDGLLEGMLRRAGCDKVEWFVTVYCLLAYRATPNINPGLTPFELLFERQK